MIRHKAGRLKRKPQVVQQRTHVLTVVEHAELPPDEHPEQDGGPTGRLTAYDERPGLNQLDQAFLLARGQLRPAPAAMVIGQAVHPLQQECLPPLGDAGEAEAPARPQALDRHVVYEQVDQHGGPPYKSDIIALIGVLKTAVEVFDGGLTDLYPDT